MIHAVGFEATSPSLNQATWEVSSCREVIAVTDPADLSDEEIAHRLATIGAQWRVASEGRKVRLHVVVDWLLDEMAERARV